MTLNAQCAIFAAYLGPQLIIARVMTFCVFKGMQLARNKGDKNLPGHSVCWATVLNMPQFVCLKSAN